MMLKIVITLLLSICAVFSTSIAQNQISKKVLFEMTESEAKDKKIIQISPKREMIIKEIQGDKNNFLLSSIDNPSEKILLFTAYNDQKPRVMFSQEGKFIYYALIENDRYILGIYEIATDKRFFIRDETNNVVSSWSAVSSTSGKIIYQVREEGALTKVFLAQPDGSEPRFITEGIGERWAPNGKWFAVKCPENISDFKILQKQNFNGKTKRNLKADNIKWVYRIFSENGNPFISLGEYSPTSVFLWSPNSKYVLLKKLYEAKFSILELAESPEELRIVRNYSISFPKKEKIGLGIPTWSPDSKNLAYTISYLDKTGHYYTKNEIWVSTIDGMKTLKIQESEGSIEEIPIWLTDGKILINQNKAFSGGMSIIEISISDF